MSMDNRDQDADNDAGAGAEVRTLSDAEIIEAESGLETPAAPTGEADWSETSTDSAAAEEADVDPDPERVDSTLPDFGPTTSVIAMRDAVDLDAAKEPVARTESVEAPEVRPEP